MRSDKAKNIAKVAKVVLENPLANQREIAEETWLSLWNVNDKLNKLEQTKDDRIIWLTDKDFELMEIIQKRKFERMFDTEKPVSDNDMNNWDREAKARFTLFRWDATDNEWWLKNIDNIDIL